MNRVDRPKYRYRIDAGDVLVWVDSWWLAFARENGAADLVEDRVVGCSLWDFVADDNTCNLYREIHSRVRDTGKTALVSFRCDSPAVRRDMRLSITREDAGQLLYEGVLLRVQPHQLADLLEPTRPRSNALLTMCSCCKRALVEPAGWLDLEQVTAKLRLLERNKPPQLRYTVCGDCVEASRRTAGDGNAA